MMNYIHLSPNFPPTYFHFAKGLKNFGVNVLGIGDAPYENLHPELHKSLTEYYKVESLDNFHELSEAVSYFMNKYGQIDGLDSHNEYWLETESVLRTAFSIDGLKVNDMDVIRRKSSMKARFRMAGLAVAEGELIQNPEDAESFIEKNGYPVIIKPDSGVGAISTYKITDILALQNFINNQPDGQFFIEQFIEGEIYSFDGLVDQQGNLIFYTAMKNQMGVMEVVNKDLHTFYYTLREIPQDLLEAGLKTIKAFDLKKRFFHFEFFRETNTNKLIALEVNMRPPGGFSTDMFNFASDINLYDTWAEMIAYGSSKLQYIRKYHVCFVSRKWRYTYKYSHDDILEKYGAHIVYYGVVDQALSRGMGNFCYIVRHPDTENIFQIQRDIHQTVKPL